MRDMCSATEQQFHQQSEDEGFHFIQQQWAKRPLTSRDKIQYYAGAISMYIHSYLHKHHILYIHVYKPKQHRC